jgi:hypothetical protein
MKTKHWIILILVVAAIAFIVARATAQTAQPQLVLCSGVHTSCTFPTGAPSAMVATDGLWYTPNGSSPVNVAAPQSGGVTSVSVNGGTAQSGAVTLTIPSTATLPAQALTLK